MNHNTSREGLVLIKKCIVALLLAFSLASLAGCGSITEDSRIEDSRIEINNFQNNSTSQHTFEELVISYPSYSPEDSSGWIAHEEEQDGALYFYFLHGAFSVFCRNSDVDVTELNTKERTVLTTGYSDPQVIQYDNSTWEVQTFSLELDSIKYEGFLATAFFNDRKYFIFAQMNGVDMRSDFEKVMNSIYFKEDLSMYYDGAYDSRTAYPLVTITDIRTGSYDNQIVAIDAILGHYNAIELNDPQNLLDLMHGNTEEVITSLSIGFDAWFFDGTSYLCMEDWVIREKHYSPYFMDQFDKIDDGDKVRLYFHVDYRGYFSSDLLPVWIELLEKSSLESQGIEYPVDIEREDTQPIQNTQEPNVSTIDEEVDTERVVYITDTGSKYHTATCRWVSNSCIEVSYEDAKTLGYTPCGTCLPRD